MKQFLVVAALVLGLSVPAAAGERASLEDELDLFAAAFLDRLQAKSIAEGVEYCGLFGFDASGALAATEARRGEVDS